MCSNQRLIGCAAQSDSEQECRLNLAKEKHAENMGHAIFPQIMQISMTDQPEKNTNTKNKTPVVMMT